MFSVSVSLSNHSTHTKHKTQNTNLCQEKKEKKTNAIIKSTYMQDNYLNVHARLHLLLPPPSSVYLFQRYQCYIYIYISPIIIIITTTTTTTHSHSYSYSYSHSFSVVDKFINWFCPEKNTPRNNSIMESSSPSQLMKNKKNKNNLIN